MRLRAQVRNVTLTTTHSLRGTRGDVTSLPDPSVVEVVEQGGSFYLLRLDEHDECIADTWHQTVEAAKAQAAFEYEIKDGDWIAVNNSL